MSVDVRIPTLGESVTEGVILRWLKAEGDPVHTDDLLLELETDKASVEIPAESGGVLHIVKAEGEKVQVGDVVAQIEPDGAARPSPTAAAPAADTAKPQPTAATAATKAPSPAPAAAALSPAVRRLVEEHGLEPAQIPASGRGGRLTKADVLAHVETIGVSAAEEPTQPKIESADAEARPAPLQPPGLKAPDAASGIDE